MMSVGLVVSALLLIVLALAGWGPAPRRAPTAVELRGLLVATFALYGAAVAAALCRRAPVAEIACAAGVAASALAGWLSRGARPGGDDGPGSGSGPGEPPVDWDGFDRARHGWKRPRASVRR